MTLRCHQGVCLTRMEQMLDFLEHFENAWPAEALMRYKLQRYRQGHRALDSKTLAQPSKGSENVPTQVASGRTITDVSQRVNVEYSKLEFPDRDCISSSTPRRHPVPVALTHPHPALQVRLVITHTIMRYVAV